VSPSLALASMMSNGEYVVNGKSPSNYAPQTVINLTGSRDSRQDARLADQVAKAVQRTMGRHNAPDNFRRSATQKRASEFMASQRAHDRNN
jgi:hypothetical protein